MIHVAIMKKEWGFLEKILNGTKTIESRWYKNKYAPWNRISKEDIVYFKNSGGPISVRVKVRKVMQYSCLKPDVKKILDIYGKNIGIEKKDVAEFARKFRGKKYRILIFLAKPQTIKPFQINKKSFSPMASWMTIENINSVKII